MIDERMLDIELVLRQSLKGDVLESVLDRISTVLKDASGGDSSVDRVLRSLASSGVMDEGSLEGCAAQAAARELVASWVDALNELHSPEGYSEPGELTSMMVDDLEHVIRILRSWQHRLVGG